MLNSDDGSRLYLNERCVINNDGGHAPLTKYSTLDLQQGYYALELPFFESGGGEVLELTMKAPGDKLPRPVPADWLFHKASE